MQPYTHRLLAADDAEGPTLPLWLATESGLASVLAGLEPAQRRWATAQGFAAERGRVLTLPDADGALAGAIAGLGSLASADGLGVFDASAWPEKLCGARFELRTALASPAATRVALGWLLAGYRYAAERAQPPRPVAAAALRWPAGADQPYVESAARAIGWGRDLVNTPANRLGPAELAAAAVALAAEFGGASQVHEGEALQRRFPLIHAVGMASARAPRLVDCRWPKPGAPQVTLVGKGVCFDSGGLDIKPSAGMLLMKKDMGGAACALALARLLLERAAPIELRLLVPAVENSVGSRAFRPGDVWPSRKGLTVEIGNTDAEGRLVLADALAEADEERPALMVDLATLTGAARTALGPDLPAAFGSNEALVAELKSAGEEEGDPVWPMPLWSGYDEELASRVADVANVAAGAFAGAIFGALFLKRFVTASPAWLHLDLYAWNPKDRPGRPQGGEVQCVRALYRLIRRRFG